MNAFSYTSGISSHPLLGETIGENLKKIVEKYPDAEALVCVHQNYRATYRQFYNQTTVVAKALLAHNTKNGDRLGIWAPNRYEWVLLQYATARIGVIMVNLNPAYRSHEVSFAINQSEISLAVSALSFKTSDYKKIFADVKEDCPTLKKIIYFDFDWNIFLKSAETISDEQLYEIEKTIQFDNPVSIQYTSGTTGFPKGVTLSHHNILNNGYFVGERLKYSTKDRVCIPVPFFHCFGMVMGNLASTTHGACMVIPNDAFEAVKTLETVEKEKCTSLYGVPTMFISELGLPNFKEFDLSSLRTGIMAGSPCPTEIMRRVQTKMNMKEVTVCYGMTETSPVSTQTKIGVPLEKQITTVGTVMEHLEIKIINPDTGEIVPIGESGELCTRGYSVMLKYWNNPEATKSVLDESRWMHTGDLGSMDGEGYISITGRIKDLIIRGGENISPKFIEDFLYTHPKIVDVQVIGVSSERFGEEIMAWVKLHPNAESSEEEMLEFCKDKIAYYYIPKYWKFVESFPTTASGKIRKVEMREISMQELGLDKLIFYKI